LIPWEAGTELVAQRKTGKTTLLLNLARSLFTGEEFLGKFGVRPIDGEIAFLNFKVSAAQLARWAADVGISPDQFYIVNLRGRRNPFSNTEDRQRLAATLKARGTEAIFCDPFGRAYTGQSQNDPGEVGAWLVELDLFARGEVGALDVVLSAHAGWNGERTRGSSALEDWADSIITMTRDDSKDGTGERFLRAIGRDVDLEEDQLTYDANTRTLTLVGTGSRKAAARKRRAEKNAETLREEILKLVAKKPR
jgi:RecA-family ATPase